MDREYGWMMTRMLAGMLGCLLIAPVLATQRHADASESAGVGRVVQALCPKDVVMLGEDNHHASSTTLRVKVELVKRLVGQCGFRGVVFESQFYDMLDFERSLARGVATRHQLSDAIGPLWSHYPQVMPLVHWLYQEARLGRVRIGGMDPQAGNIDEPYSAQKLPGVLSAVLNRAHREECEHAIYRQNNQTYDQARPFDRAVMFHLRACLHDIRDRLTKMGRKAPRGLKAMADSYAAYLEIYVASQLKHDITLVANRRDRAMYVNFMWWRAHWPKGTRIVVWCATVHAAKSSKGWDASIRPFGSYVHARFGSRAAAIGFSALGGTYGNVGGHGKPHAIPHAHAGSMEARAFEGQGPRAMRFVDRAQLHAMGKVSSRVINFAKPYTLDWSRVLDGVIVLRREVAAKAKS